MTFLSYKIILFIIFVYILTILLVHILSIESFATDATSSSSNFGNVLIFILIMSEAMPLYGGRPGLISHLLGGLLNLLIPSKSAKSTNIKSVNIPQQNNHIKNKSNKLSIV